MPRLSASGSGSLPPGAFDFPAVRDYAIIHPDLHQPSLRFAAHRDRSASKPGESRRPAKAALRSNWPAYSRIHPLGAVGDGVAEDGPSRSAHLGPPPKWDFDLSLRCLLRRSKKIRWSLARSGFGLRRNRQTAPICISWRQSQSAVAQIKAVAGSLLMAEGRVRHTFYTWRLSQLRVDGPDGAEGPALSRLGMAGRLQGFEEQEPRRGSGAHGGAGGDA